jgi:hypothetical protein
LITAILTGEYQNTIRQKEQVLVFYRAVGLLELTITFILSYEEPEERNSKSQRIKK